MSEVTVIFALISIWMSILITLVILFGAVVALIKGIKDVSPMKKEKLVASALAFNTLLTAFTINAKAKTLDVPYIYEEEKYGESQLGRELNYYHIENEKQEDFYKVQEDIHDTINKQMKIIDKITNHTYKLFYSKNYLNLIN